MTKFLCLVPLALAVGCWAGQDRAGSGASRELSSSTVAAQALKHVVSIKAPGAQGSGFFISEDEVLTCLHVVRGRSNILVRSEHWSGRAVAVMAWDEELDLAVLKVNPAREEPGLPLWPAESEVGSKVMVVSSPLGLTNSISDGVVSARRTQPRELLQFTAPISPGSSGGPLLNLHGQAIGVVMSTVTVVEGGHTYGQNLNFAVPSGRILHMLKSARELPIAAFAELTLAPEERRWTEIESSLSGLESSLATDLGDRVGGVLAVTLRDTVASRDMTSLESLAKRWRTLKQERVSVLEVAEQLSQAGDTGPRMAQKLLASWEENSIHTTDTTQAQFEAERANAHAFLAVHLRQMRLRDFPDSFAGFPFLAKVSDICRLCFPGCAMEPTRGLKSMGCPNMPIVPPFAKRDQTVLSFLDGRLVAVSVGISSYRDAVQAINEKYGEPHFLAYHGEHWEDVSFPSYEVNTAFEWTLKGGRIRVGQRGDGIFAVFIRNEHDSALSASY